jgi:ABC-type antimicrobial peptide transport system permease subunit
VPNSNPSVVAKEFTNAYSKARNGDLHGATFLLQNIADMHLISADGNDSAKKMVNIFTLVLAFLLLIAAINYINLTTARSLMRVKEVSMRKIIGANKVQLFLQFSFETLFVFIVAAIIAVGLIYLCMPVYNQISGVQLSFGSLSSKMWLMLSATVIATYLASSFYPAMLLSSFNPLQSMKGKINSFLSVTFLRKSLVVLQFAISVILLTCTIVMSRQMNFLRNKDLGYDKNYVFSVALPGEVMQHIDAIKNELRSQPEITGVALSDAYNIADVGRASSDLNWPGKPADNNMIITQLCADKDFIPTMKIQMAEGSNFSGTPADSAHFILNETAVKKIGLAKPYIGQQIGYHQYKGTLIGIVKDFNFKSLKEKIDPLIIFTNWGKNILTVRTNAAGAQQAIAAVEKQYKKYADITSPFNYKFLDESFDEMYKSETRAGLLFTIFAGIAIFISCLGLFGLATYTAQVKTKEIGIRKVLGASVQSIVKLISLDFLKLVVISILIAIPIAWMAMSKWLQDFEYKANLSWWIFFVSGIISLLIAFITISFQSIKAAMANPVKSIKTE